MPLGAALRDVVLVGCDRLLVRLHGIDVAPDSHVDVRRHVDDVSRAGHQRQQPIRFLLGALGRPRRFPEVNPVMERTGMLRIGREHALDGRQRLRRAVVGQAVAGPVVPRPQVHQRLGEQRAGIEIAREPTLNAAHGLGIRAVGLLPVGGNAGVTGAQRLDVGPLARRGGRRRSHRLLHERQRLRLVVRRHRRVDVGTEHERLAPVGHRAGGIQPRRFGERATRLGMIEAVGEVQALVDELLRAGRSGRDRKRVRAEVLQSRCEHASRPGLRRGVARS